MPIAGNTTYLLRASQEAPPHWSPVADEETIGVLLRGNGGTVVVRQEALHDEQRRLLRIAARMPLASITNFVPTLGMAEDRVRRMLNTLRNGGWVASVFRGMTERRQYRWFLTRKAVDLLYATDHRHPSPREEARAAALAALHPDGELPADFAQQFALDHDHPAHLEDMDSSPFVANGDSGEADSDSAGLKHEHPPWTATSRGVEVSLRRLGMLEPVYRLAPDLLRSGRVNWPTHTSAASREVRMTDFRLLRRGGFYHAVARYGKDVWTPFTYAGLHATERVLRRKEQHRFWGVDSYSHEEDRYVRIGNRVFYEDPEQAVEPSARIVVASDAWARELAQNTLTVPTPTVFCTASGQCSPAVELRPSRDLVSDPTEHPSIGRPEELGLWLRKNPDMEAIDGRTAQRLFMTIAQFPAMRAPWLKEVVKGSTGDISRHLARFVETGLVAVFNGRHYLSELGMKRAANMSRVTASVIRSRHGPYLDRWYREHEVHHNDGVNRVVVQFAREGVEAVAGWRGEINIPDITQVRPDLLIRVSEGPFGAGAYYMEFERSAVSPREVSQKLRPYRRMAVARSPLPMLVVCETQRGVENFRAAGGELPMLTVTQEQAVAGPLTGGITVWSRGGGPEALHCSTWPD